MVGHHPPPKPVMQFLRKDIRSFIYYKWSDVSKEPPLYVIDPSTDFKDINAGQVFSIDNVFYKVTDKLVKFLKDADDDCLRPILNVYVKELEVEEDTVVKNLHPMPDKEELDEEVSKSQKKNKAKAERKRKAAEKARKEERKKIAELKKQEADKLRSNEQNTVYKRKIKCKVCDKMYLKTHKCKNGEVINRWEK